MEYPEVPSSYKNFLPSKHLQRIIVIFLIGIVLLLIIITLKNSGTLLRRPAPAPQEPLLATTETSSVRSTLGDGIPDWQKILVGLDPKDPASTQLFQERKHALEQEGVWGNINTVSSNDQLGIEIGENLATTTNLTDDVINQETVSSVLRYAEEIKSQFKHYSRIDIEESEVTNPETTTQYINQLNEMPDIISLLQKNLPTIEAYFAGQLSKNSLNPLFRDISQHIEKLLIIPAPSGLDTLHIQFIDTLYTVYQTLDSFESIDESDDLRRFATITLFQSSMSDLGRIWLYITTYGNLQTQVLN